MASALYYNWICDLGIPSVGFWSDRGNELKNKTMKEMSERFKLNLSFGPAYSPWYNGLHEKNHHLAGVIIQKVMKQDPSLKLAEVIKLAS